MNKIVILGIVSLVLIAVGGGYYAIEGALTLLSAGMLWAGLMMLLFLLYAKFDDVKKITMKKSAKYGANMVIMVGVFFLVILFAAVLGHAHKQRLDLTRSGRFTLSSQTKKILQGLKVPVKAVAFFRSESGTMHAKQKQTARDLLEEFAAQSKNFTYTFIDPDQNPGMAQKYGVTEYRIVLFMSGGKQVKIGNEREETYTNSLIKLLQEKQKVVYFVKGHGEKEVSSATKTGYSAAAKALSSQNFELREIVLAQAKEIPNDASVVVVASPDKDLMPEEYQKLDAYFKGGGALFVMIDPGHPPAMVTWLETYGFKLTDDVIIDQQSQLYGANNLTPVVYAYHKKHPLTQDFRLLTFFPIAESVFIDEDTKKGSYQLALTGPNSWASLDKKGLESGNVKYDETREKRGPIPIMSVTTWAAKGTEDTQGGKRDRYGKIIVVGDSDFADNTNFNLAGNGDLFLNTVSWLAEEADLVAVRAKKKDVTPVVLTAAQGRAIFWIPVVMVPGSILLIGLGIYSKRRWFRQ